ncbi:MAG: DUF373 family protein [Candidatus Aenigmatarchaeota archaeon]
MSSEDKILILCVDRDDDVSRKTEMKGPVIGKDENLRLANNLALADPEDSDSNAIFQAVKFYNEMKDDYNVEVATITGNPQVGIKSDEELTKQLEDTLGKTNSDKALLVTDGTEDEHIIPIIQSYVKIMSVEKVIMKQSERLEGMYYMIHDFFREIVNEPKMARLALGIPALILLLYALFGATGWRLILGGLGVYLLIKGFQLEGPIHSAADELKTSFTTRRLSFFFYVVSIVIVFIGIKGGYDSIQIVGANDLMESSAAFLNGYESLPPIYLLFLGFMTSFLGKGISSYPERKSLKKFGTLIFLGLAVTIVGKEASYVILNPGVGLMRLFMAIIFGLLLTSITLTISKYYD